MEFNINQFVGDFINAFEEENWLLFLIKDKLSKSPNYILKEIANNIDFSLEEFDEQQLEKVNALAEKTRENAKERAEKHNEEYARKATSIQK